MLENSVQRLQACCVSGRHRNERRICGKFNHGLTVPNAQRLMPFAQRHPQIERPIQAGARIATSTVWTGPRVPTLERSPLGSCSHLGGAEGTDQAASDIDLMVVSDNLSYEDVFGALDKVSGATASRVSTLEALHRVPGTARHAGPGTRGLAGAVQMPRHAEPDGVRGCAGR